MRNFSYVILLSILSLAGCSAIASTNITLPTDRSFTPDHDEKYEFCDKNWGNSKRASAKDLREIKIPTTNLLTVDGRKNGGISVKGESRSDILIRACIRAWSDSQAEADSIVKNTKISTGSVVKAENSGRDSKYSVSYQILVPNSTNLKLTAHNGGISISSVQGDLDFETKNGGVSLSGVGGNVKGMTQNGGLSVKLSGNRWNGNGLNVETQNGGVSLSMPSNYSADVETGTVNGGLRSDFKGLQTEKKDGRRGYRNKKISASINGGGPKIRVVTTNGGVRIKSSD